MNHSEHVLQVAYGWNEVHYYARGRITPEADIQYHRELDMRADAMMTDFCPLRVWANDGEQFWFCFCGGHDDPNADTEW